MLSHGELVVWNDIIKSCKIIFDVGCREDNDFYDINPQANIYLFDPNPVNKLYAKIKDKPNVFFNNVALGNTTGDLDFYYPYGSFMHRTEEPKFKHLHKTKKVKMVRLEDFIKEHNITSIDYLKIDCEGYDFEVIKGCGNFINSIKYIQFEEFGNFYCNIKSKDIFNYFKGWSIYKIEGSPVNYLVTKEKLKLELRQLQ